MSQHQPPPRPGPYAGPSPYAQGGAPAQPGQGFEQQGYGAGGPYGQPPQPGPTGRPGPYAQPGSYGQPGPYAQPPQPGPYGQPGAYGRLPVPPQRSGSTGRTIGIAVAAVAVVAAIVGGIVLLGGGDDGRYKLTTPRTVAAEFTRQGAGHDDSALSPSDKAALRRLPGVVDPHPVQAGYQSAGKKQLLLTGVWGRVDNPGTVVDAMFAVLAKAAAEGAEAEPVGSPQDVEPDGFDGDVMKCQKIRFTNDDPSAPVKAAEVPMCAWGDSSTVGGVILIDPLAALAGDTDLDAAAGTAAKVRDDARVELPGQQQ